MTLSSRSRAFVLALAALAALAACNPLTAPVPTEGSVVSVQYEGPADGWLEVSVTGFEGYSVDFQILILNTFPAPRTCRDATTGAIEPCQQTDIVNVTDLFAASASFRPVVSPLDADLLNTSFTCRQGGVAVACPPSLRATLRVVDAEGDLVGDLTA
jgi:hypothetical protein